VTSILSPSERKVSAISTRNSTPSVRRRPAPAADRRSRSRISTDHALRARADAAIINQWLFEQTDRTRAGSRSPKAPAAA
jgi:hypothetical protein